jgi:type IV pilus biogenesis protein PilP
MFNRNVFASMAVLALASSFPAFAQTPVAPQPPAQPAAPQLQPAVSKPASSQPQPAVSSAPKVAVQPSREAARIAEINERIAVMSAQLAELEMQSKIYAKRTEIEKSQEAGRGIAVDENFIPSVKEINGIDGRIWAVLNVAGGNTQIVHVGDRVGSWRVSQILADSVTVKRGNDTIRLSFGFVTQNAPGTPTPGMGMPGVPVNNVLPPFPAR